MNRTRPISPPAPARRAGAPVSAAVVGVLVATLVLAACGSTRYVVVQGPAAGIAPTTSTAPAGPTAVQAERGIRRAISTALSLDPKVDFAHRQAYLVDADDTEPTFDAVRELVKSIDAELAIDAITVRGTAGTATVTISVAGEPLAKGVPVAVVDDGGTWKVTRDGACAALAVGSPCPDKP